MLGCGVFSPSKNTFRSQIVQIGLAHLLAKIRSLILATADLFPEPETSDHLS